VVSTSNAGATLTRRVHQDDPKEAIDNSQWAFADCSATPFPGTPNAARVCLNGGFDTNHIYELVYTAKNPTVTGIGFAATRVSFLRGGNKGSAGPVPANPLGKSIDYAIIYGSSQSGRWIRTFLELGFNEGEDHERVVEGAIRTKRRTAAPSISASPSRRGCREPSTPKSNSRVRNHHRPGVIPPTRLLGSLPGSSIAVGSRTPARKSRRPRPTPSIGRP
jgi:hypothetical protein